MRFRWWQSGDAQERGGRYIATVAEASLHPSSLRSYPLIVLFRIRPGSFAYSSHIVLSSVYRLPVVLLRLDYSQFHDVWGSCGN